MRERIELTWELGVGTDPTEWIPAAVPGAVQLDWARANGWTDPAWADSVEPYMWMEDTTWTYRTHLPEVAGLWLVIEQVDHACHVLVGGQRATSPLPTEHVLESPAMGGAEVRVVVEPAPKSHFGPPDRAQANQSTKPAVAYGWDFHPRLIPLGICGSAYAERRPTFCLGRTETRSLVRDDLRTADVLLQCSHGNPDGARIRWCVLDPAGAVVHDRAFFRDYGSFEETATLHDVLLWWPHDHGPQPLYVSRVELLGEDGEVVDAREQRFGFRRVRLVMAEGQWDDPASHGFPKGPNKPPITLEINGRQIFAKGSNWVCPDIFPGRIPVSRWKSLIETCKSANMNLLRCWGGAQPPGRVFYEASDELGMMVWQEFPLACNRYESTEPYLRELENRALGLVTSLRHHPSHVLWCGGNELFNEWSRMTDQDRALRLLDTICLTQDPEKPFIKTAPLHGMGHGSYEFLLADGRDVLQMMQAARCTAYTEFGVPGPSSAEVLESITPESERWPPRPAGAWLTRHAFRSWSEHSWLYFDTIEQLLGPCRSMQDMVEKGQILQALGLQLAFEEARRQKPSCAMALNWCLTEPWPTAANNSVIQWDGTPKPALDKIRAALRPAMLSLQFAGFRVRPDEPFTVQPWFLNDTPAKVGPLEAEIRVQGIHVHNWSCPGASENRHQSGPTISVRAPSESGLFTIEIADPSDPEMDSKYHLLVQS